MINNKLLNDTLKQLFYSMDHTYDVHIYSREKGDYMISSDEILMGREAEYPLTIELADNLKKLLIAVNQFRQRYGKPMFVSSGYRPGHYNKDANGAANSSHITCEAVDFHDADGTLKDWIANNLSILEECDLYMEDPKATKTWVHLTTRAPKSGKRVFMP